MTYPIVSDDPEVQAHYELCRAQGTSHTLAEMFAFQQVPGCMTDAVFNQGRVNGNQWDTSPFMRKLGNQYKKIAAKAGVSVTGKTYLPGLAEFPGDPEAWVDGRGDVERVVRKKGMNCTGAVNIPAPEPKEPPKEIDVAESIVQERVAAELAKNPEQRPLDVRERVKARLRPHWKRKQE